MLPLFDTPIYLFNLNLESNLKLEFNDGIVVLMHGGDGPINIDLQKLVNYGKEVMSEEINSEKFIRNNL